MHSYSCPHECESCALFKSLTAPELICLRAHNTIGAITLIRERLGCGLYEAKQLCDTWYERYSQQQD